MGGRAGGAGGRCNGLALGPGLAHRRPLACAALALGNRGQPTPLPSLPPSPFTSPPSLPIGQLERGARDTVLPAVVADPALDDVRAPVSQSWRRRPGPAPPRPPAPPKPTAGVDRTLTPRHPAEYLPPKMSPLSKVLRARGPPRLARNPGGQWAGHSRLPRSGSGRPRGTGGRAARRPARGACEGPVLAHRADALSHAIFKRQRGALPSRHPRSNAPPPKAPRPRRARPDAGAARRRRARARLRPPPHLPPQRVHEDRVGAAGARGPVDWGARGAQPHSGRDGHAAGVAAQQGERAFVGWWRGRAATPDG